MIFDNFSGQMLDRYQIVRRLGEDGLGVLFQAHEPTTQRDFAIKVIRPEIAGQPDFADNFTPVARAAARLDHPNLVQVFDFGEFRSLYYIVMEYIPGENLEQLLRRMKRQGQWLYLGEAVQIVQQLALALEYARSQGIQRTSLNPAGIRIKPVRSERLPYLPVMVNIGLDRLVQDGFGGADPAAHPAYLSPEAALGRTTSARSDVYTLGVLLFELAAGQRPFPIYSLEEAVRYHTRQPLPPPAAIRPDLPAELEAIIFTAMEKNPEGRFPNPVALVDALSRVAPTAHEIRSTPPALETAVSLLEAYRESLEDAPGEGPDAETLRTLVSAPTVAAPAAVTQVSTPRSSLGQVDILLEDAKLAVEPGNAVSTTLTLINRGQTAGHFRVAVEGLPPEWLALSPQLVELQPGERREVTLSIQPERAPHSRAGRYSMTVLVTGPQGGGPYGDARGTLTVGAYYQFATQLYTPRLSHGETGQVAINNQSNLPETFTLTFRDPQNELSFNPPQAQMRLMEGQSGVVEFQAGARAPRWVGSEKTHVFQAQVTGGGETQSQRGEFVSLPIMPTWILGLLLFVFLCLAGSAAVLLGGSGLQASRATAAVAARWTETARAGDAALQATFQAETATAEALLNANDATQAAATVTALYVESLPTQTPTPDLPLTQQVEATQTAGVQQTLQAVVDATTTAQVAAIQTATVQAAAAAAQTATAQAAAASVQTATAQAAAAAAAAAQTATAQAVAVQTAQAAALTATAQAATPTPPQPQARLAYIFTTGQAEAVEFQEMLQENGYQVDLLPLNTIENVDLQPYQVILIGPETGSAGEWGDAEGNQANFILASENAILGLGSGGNAFFGRVELDIGWDNGLAVTGPNVLVLDPADPVWSTPNRIQIPANGVIPLYEASVPLLAVSFEEPDADINLIGGRPRDTNQYTIVREDGQYLLWSYAGAPNLMTPAGRLIFLNVVQTLLP